MKSRIAIFILLTMLFIWCVPIQGKTHKKKTKSGSTKIYGRNLDPGFLVNDDDVEVNMEKNGFALNILEAEYDEQSGIMYCIWTYSPKRFLKIDYKRDGEYIGPSIARTFNRDDPLHSDYKIRFRNETERDKFLEGLKELGFLNNETGTYVKGDRIVHIDGNIISITYSHDGKP